MFLVGNMTALTTEDTVWRPIRAELERQGAIGSKMPLVCQVHGTVTEVGSANDFELCPQGGCLKPCGIMLDCGHTCAQVCHIIDREHNNFK